MRERFILKHNTRMKKNRNRTRFFLSLLHLQTRKWQANFCKKWRTVENVVQRYDGKGRDQQRKSRKQKEHESKKTKKWFEKKKTNETNSNLEKCINHTFLKFFQSFRRALDKLTEGRHELIELFFYLLGKCAPSLLRCVTNKKKKRKKREFCFLYPFFQCLKRE